MPSTCPPMVSFSLILAKFIKSTIFLGGCTGSHSFTQQTAILSHFLHFCDSSQIAKISIFLPPFATHLPRRSNKKPRISPGLFIAKK